MAKKIFAQPHSMPYEETKPQTGEPSALAALHRPLTNEDIDKVRHIEGFPIGSDEDIIALSDPPYYTACPNPFLEDFVRAYGKPYDEATDDYYRPAYFGTVRASKTHPLSNAHSYLAKSSPGLVAILMQHYCNVGDVVLDGFAGSGMSGVAAQELGINSVLVDLSPFATFISAVNCQSLPYERGLAQLEHILENTERELGYLYETQDAHGHKGTLRYAVWTDVFICFNCGSEIPFFPHGVIQRRDKVEIRKMFRCPNCGIELHSRAIERAFSSDGEKKKALCWVNALVGNNAQDRLPTEFDLNLAAHIESQYIPYWYPRDPIDPKWDSARLAQLEQKRIGTIDRMVSRRNLWAYSALFARIREIAETDIRLVCFYALTGVFNTISERQTFSGFAFPNTLYLPNVRLERNVFQSVRLRLNKLRSIEKPSSKSAAQVHISTQSSTDLASVPDESIDYIYTDPPFGASIQYSEMNVLLEGWLRVKTSHDPEAVINKFQQKSIFEYHELMRRTFSELFRVLKPEHWITVMFHSSDLSIWETIQQGLAQAGFVIAQTGTVERGSIAINKEIHPTATRTDIIISAFKPGKAFENRFLYESDPEAGVWDFVREQLKHQPVFLEGNEIIATNPERQKFLLFDRVVSFYVNREKSVPITASAFYEKLGRQFPERDEMFFIAEQVASYDIRRIKASSLYQPEFKVWNEKSALQWLRRELEREPHTYLEISRKYSRVLAEADYERIPDLEVLLSENFLKNEDERWFVPDATKSDDLEGRRERALLEEFEAYRKSEGDLGLVRTEAIRAGFKAAWQASEYGTVLDIANRVPREAIQSNQELFMYYDIALVRNGAK